METETFDVEGLVLIKPRIFGDARGFFLESYNRRRYEDAGVIGEFVQDNHSRSTRGVLRGLHYQVGVHAQSKLLRVLAGEIYDVAVDLRPSSVTYGRWIGVHLSAENQHQFYVPKGFAHGFQVVSETAEVAYKCDAYYAPQDERGVLWSDPDLAIPWPDPIHPLLSDKDRVHPLLRDVDKTEAATMIGGVA